MEFLELTSRPSINLTDTSVFGVQDADGLTYKQTNLLAIKSDITSAILGANNLFTGSNIFSNVLVIPNGVLSTHAVNLSQLNDKNDKITGTTFHSIVINASGIMQTNSQLQIIDNGILIDGITDNSGITLRAGYLNIGETFTPASSSDSKGEDRDLTYDEDYIYVKVGGGWKRILLAAF